MITKGVAEKSPEVALKGIIGLKNKLEVRAFDSLEPVEVEEDKMDNVAAKDNNAAIRFQLWNIPAIESYEESLDTK